MLTVSWVGKNGKNGAAAANMGGNGDHDTCGENCTMGSGGQRGNGRDSYGGNGGDSL